MSLKVGDDRAPIHRESACQLRDCVAGSVTRNQLFDSRRIEAGLSLASAGRTSSQVATVQWALGRCE